MKIPKLIPSIEQLRSSISNRYLSIISGRSQGSLLKIATIPLLSLFASLYRIVLEARYSLYQLGLIKRTTLPVPVISVGNITTGGTGKTPIVEYIASYLKDKGRRVAILSRGYRSNVALQIKDRVHNRVGEVASTLYNDECLMLRENMADIPNIIGKDRVESGRMAVTAHKADCLVLDDGFQCLRLNRSLDIVVIDALNPFGYGHLIPYGLLREPLTCLKRADLFVISHTDLCPPSDLKRLRDRLAQISNNVPIVETIHHPIHLEKLCDPAILTTEYLDGKMIYAFCAIGNPESFFRSLLHLGVCLIKTDPFLDHHLYKEDELRRIIKEARLSGADAIVTTQKDKVKILEVMAEKDVMACEIPILILKVAIKIVSGKEYLEGLVEYHI